MKCIPVFRLLVCTAVLWLTGCGGQVTDSFAHSVYIEITNTHTLSPVSTQVPNGYRIVFLNNDGISHTVNWDNPLVLSAVAQPGSRAWFELPGFFPGTVLGYHLDASGPTGTVTIVPAP
jgi:hypothetical protein